MDNNELTQKINQIKEDLKTIHSFDEKTNIELNNWSQEIDTQVTINNFRIEKYKQYKKDNPKSLERFEMALDIYNENFKISNEKFKLFKRFSEDLYGRIERLGKDIRLLTDVVEQVIVGKDD